MDRFAPARWRPELPALVFGAAPDVGASWLDERAPWVGDQRDPGLRARMRQKKPAMRIVVLALCTTLAAPAVAERQQIGPIQIDRTEVTISAFAAFTERSGLVTMAEQEGGGFEWGAGWERRPGWTFRTPFGTPAAPDEPAVHVSWSEAQAFCTEAGGRLPTRAEWTQAAYTESRAPAADGFVTGQTYAYPVGDSPEGMNSGSAGHVPVGTTRVGVNGLFDMGANAWEWLADRDGSRALTAGGSWWYGAEKTRAGGMQWKPAEFYALYVGFRCVYGPAQ